MPKKRLIAAILAVTFPLTTAASVQDEMTAWFNDMGSYANLTMPQAVRGQTTTAFTGGGLYMRSPVRTYQLATANPPSVRAGCGGIDFHAGSFSFINSEQLTALLRNIANNAVGYAFMMAVQSVSPDLADLLKYLQDQAAKMNNLNINSCAAAENLLAMTPLPGWASQKAKERQNAQSNGAGMLNAFSDSLDAFTNFMTNAGTRKDLVDRAANADPNLKKYLKPGNVVWEAMEKSNAPRDVKEIMMSLIGTIIIFPSDSTGEPKVKTEPGILTFKNLIGTPKEATTPAHLLRCVSYSEGNDGLPACAAVTDTTENIVPFAYRVRQLMEAGTQKISTRAAQAFSEQEKFFLSGSSTPLWKLIASSANSPAGAAVISDEYAMVVAAEVTYGYLNGVMLELNKTLANAKETRDPVNQAAIEKVISNYYRVETNIREEMTAIYVKAASIAETQRKIQWIHETMMQGVSGDIRKSLAAFGGR